jgi:hypothetical protein
MPGITFIDNVGVGAFGSTASDDALINASGSQNVITFTKGDNSQFTITVDTGSGGGFFNTSSLLITASVAGSDLTFTKGDGSTFTVALPSGGGGGGGGIFNQIGSTDQFQATSSLRISGSTLFSTPLAHSTNMTASEESAKYAFVSSQSLWHYNANVGVPTTNPWKTNLEGTFFNRFDHNSDISEMLRYMVGVLSGSEIGPAFADTSPNTKFWNSVSTAYSGQNTYSRDSLFDGVLGDTYENARLSQHWTSSAFIDFSKTASFREAQQYYIAKGFVQESDRGTFGNDTGTNPFHGSYSTRLGISNNILRSDNFASLTFTNTSVAGGSTSVTSGDSQFFGMGELTNGGPTEYFVQIATSQSYLDTYSASPNPSNSPTFITSSNITYSTNAFGTSGDGLLLGKINPPSAQLPAAFQDGKFQNVDGPITGRKYTGEATSNTTISSSGYYEMHDVIVGLKTGSMSTFQTKNGSDSSIVFYTPNPYQGSFTSAGALQDITDGAPTVTISDELTRTAFSATSRSLSGAPYLLTTTYSYTYNTQVSKSFDPAYAFSTTPIQTSNPTDTWDNVGNTTLSNTSVTINSNGIATSATTAGVFPAGSNPSNKRNTSIIPHIDDVAFLSSSFAFTLTATNNVVQSKSTQENTNYSLTFRTTGRNWKNSSQTSTSATQNYYDATLFDQPSASGSMAIYSAQAQGGDGGSLTGTSETFSGENFRVKLTNNALTGIFASADKFVTGSFTLNNLTEIDLQVKPGFLVVPGSTNGYWLPTIGSSVYKYYARAFQTNGTTFSSMTVNVGKSTLKNWTNTSDDGIAIGIVYQSGGSGTLGTPVLIDIADTTGGNTGVTTPQAGLNPFSTNIDIKSNDDSIASSGNTYTISMNALKNKLLNGSNTNYIIFIRYKNSLNDFIQSINVAYNT